MKLTQEQRDQIWSAVYRAAIIDEIAQAQFFQEVEAILSSIKETNLVFGGDSKTHEEISREQTHLKARRARLLERIEEAKDARYEDAGWNHQVDSLIEDLQDELQAVESALGYPEPKEPSEANAPSYCPTCLCLLNHEDPMQSCQCGR